ncbi:hypothetical protein PsAD37_01952 [Pseudovibrio sp. Ad37]|nr:hypothetical protein PsAD37_01952 [Pseudovibrio sp. Ad37]
MLFERRNSNLNPFKKRLGQLLGVGAVTLAVSLGLATQSNAAECYIISVDGRSDYKSDKQGQLTQSVFAEIIISSDYPRQVTLSAIKSLAMEAVHEIGAHQVEIRQFADIDSALQKGSMFGIYLRYHPDTQRFAYADEKWFINDMDGYEAGKRLTIEDIEKSRPIAKCVPL